MPTIQNSKSNIQNLRGRIGIVAIIILAVHSMLCLYIIFVPAESSIRNRLTIVYRQLFVLGPFFSESRIKSSHYLSVRYKSEGKWSTSREFVNENLLAFAKTPFRFDRLPYNDYEKRLSYTVGEQSKKNKSFEDVKKSTAFRELNAFILKEYLKVHADSVAVLYGLEGYNPQDDVFKLDTVFYFTYNPNAVETARK
jgi:hypothetical protein